MSCFSSRLPCWSGNYGLNDCSLEFLFWSTNPQCDGVRRWGFWKVRRLRWGHKGGVPAIRLVPLQERVSESLPPFFLCAHTQKKGHVNTKQEDGRLWGRKRVLVKNHRYHCLDLWTSQPPEMWGIHVCCLGHPVCVVFCHSTAWAD